MNNDPNPPDKTLRASLLVSGDIPAAKRDTPLTSTSPTNRKPMLIGSILGLGIIVAIGIAIWLPSQTRSSSSQAPPSQNPSSPSTPSTSSARAAAGSSTQTTSSATTTQTDPTVQEDALLGHFAYEEAPQAELKAITADGRIQLRKPAAEKFRAMAEAARRSGVSLATLSGFRSTAEQDPLFFGIKAQRGQNPEKRAEVSAPPGYSEHHTGYAIDIGDGNVPAANLSPNFEQTAAFQWLQANAAYYSFELSFPENNPQGVSYEPWHWRFVGDRHSLETFYKARNLNQTSASGN